MKVSVVVPVYNEEANLAGAPAAAARASWTRRESPTRSSSWTTAAATARSRS